MHINGVIGHQALVLALVLGSGPTHDSHAVMQGTQLLLAKKTVGSVLSKHVNAKLAKSSPMETNEMLGEAGTEQ